MILCNEGMWMLRKLTKIKNGLEIYKNKWAKNEQEQIENSKYNS